MKNCFSSSEFDGPICQTGVKMKSRSGGWGGILTMALFPTEGNDFLSNDPVINNILKISLT